MGNGNEGIEGVDLLELDIISKERLPAVQGDFTSARSSVAGGGSGSVFYRSGPIGVGPDGPASDFSSLGDALLEALSQSITNLGDTADAIQQILQGFLNADHGAQGRMDQARSEMEGIPG
jgi:hypothetical protein